MGLLQEAQDLRQNLSLVGLLDIIIKICKKIEKPEMLEEPNVEVLSKGKKKK